MASEEPATLHAEEEQDVSSNMTKYSMAMGIPLNCLFYPFEFTKILIQLGHEPIAPRPTYTFFGRPALALPNIFEYFGYVCRNVGFFHMYRGVFPQLLGTVTYTYTHREVSKKIADVLKTGDESEREDQESSDNERVLLFFQSTAKDMVARGAAVVASHPFQMVAVRMVAQFIGGEEAYNWTFSAIKDIYKESGIFGFFQGLVPRLIGELLAMWICSSLTFVFNTYLVSDESLKAYTSTAMRLIASNVTYPYVLVSRVMMVNGSGMLASLPPHMPIYNGWIDCWQQLKVQNQLKRGSSIIWRYYTGPVILKDNKPQPISLKNFQRPVPSRF